MNPRNTLIAGAIFSFLSVAIGAFAAHGLKLDVYSADVFETGAKYQFYHSLALLIVGTLGLVRGSWIPKAVPALFIAGILIFSGSLYTLAITGIKALGAITPIGGVCFLLGWLMLIVSLIKNKN